MFYFVKIKARLKQLCFNKIKNLIDFKNFNNAKFNLPYFSGTQFEFCDLRRADINCNKSYHMDGIFSIYTSICNNETIYNADIFTKNSSKKINYRAPNQLLNVDTEGLLATAQKLHKEGMEEECIKILKKKFNFFFYSDR